MEKTSYQPENVYQSVGEYSQGIKVKGGSLLFIAGQVALDPQGSLVGKGDIRAQAKQVFENIKAMLESADATFKDVVKLGIFLTNIQDFPAVREVRKQYITEPFPTATVLGVKSLVHEDWLIEVEAIAVVK
jgi:reactive intermediate/imine deaminase